MTIVGRKESAAMFHPEQINPAALVTSAPSVSTSTGRGCLQDGCPCRDARIVSHRKATFFAAIARRTGETADRTIAPEPGWTLPTGDFA
jgi:hypothetical protein